MKQANHLLNILWNTNRTLFSLVLEYKSTVEDYSRRILADVTPLSVAYGAEDEEMCEMLIEHLEKLPNGRKKALAQLNEQFPEEIEKRKPYDFTSILIAIKDASDKDIQEAFRTPKLTLDQNDSLLYKAFNTFRKEFTDRSCQEGIHFNHKHLLEAYAVYVKEFYNLKDLNNSRLALFCMQVIGYVQRYLPSCYAQELCSGNDWVSKQPGWGFTSSKPLRRSFEFNHDPGLYIFPLSFDAPSKLGFEYSPCAGVALVHGALDHELGITMLDWFKNFCEAKTKSLFKLKQWLKKPVEEEASLCTLL